MSKVFISYSHQDKDFVKKLKNELLMATSEGLTIQIYEQCLKPGDSFMKIFAELGSSDFFVPVLSKNFAKSDWCHKELSLALIKEIKKSSFKVVPIVIGSGTLEDVLQLMPSDVVEALGDKIVCRFDSKPYSEAFMDLVTALAPNVSPQELYASISDPDGENPFRRVRAEHFKETKIFAELFAEPEDFYDALMSPKPAFIEGSRGSGKTMILKSMQASIVPLIEEKQTGSTKKLPFFGVYMHSTRDTFAKIEPSSLGMTEQGILGIYYDEMIIRLFQSIIEEITLCNESGIIHVDRNKEQMLCKAYAQALRLEHGEIPSNFEEIKNVLKDLMGDILDYVRAKSRREDQNYLVKSLSKDNLVYLCKQVRAILPELKDVHVCFLIDEYENLDDTQQVVLNTLLKWHNAETFAFKIANKKTPAKALQTLEEQEVEEGNDYSYVDLDFHVGEKLNDNDSKQERKRYVSYLQKICSKILIAENFKTNKIDEILEDRIAYKQKLKVTPEGLQYQQVQNEVISMLAKRGSNWNTLNRSQQKRAFGHFSIAAEYRLLGQKSRSFGGLHDLVALSSGNVRVFLELCGASYYYARQDNVKVKSGEKISIKHQTEGANKLSGYYLSRVSRNIEFLGPILRDFATDLGDIFHQKLLKHLSEPEAALLYIEDPQRLSEQKVKFPDEKGAREYTVKKIIDIAILHSVLQEYGRRRGKNPENQPYDYVLNRIFAPALEFSPRTRWPTHLYSEDVQGLLDPSKRMSTRKRLIDAVTKERKGKRKTLSEYPIEEIRNEPD